MTRKLCLTLAVISATLTMATAQQTTEITPSGIGYLQYLPHDYHSNAREYPVVISLHGIKEKGTSSTDPKRVLQDLAKVDNVGLPKYVRQGKQFPFILISPQLKSKYGTWPPAFVMEVLKHVRKKLRIDERRIYLTGLSLGGFGVWKTAGAYPEVFAAIAPVCAGGNALDKAGAIAAEDLPVWSFHGSSDNIVSYTVTTRMVNAINDNHPNPLAKVTLFPHMGHVIWDRAYLQTNLLDWMLRFRKGSRPPQDEHDGQEAQEEKKNNSRPVATAGPDRTITLPSDGLTLEGRASDKDGKIASWEWKQLSGDHVQLSGTSSARLHMSSLEEGEYAFRLTVKDNEGATDSDDVRVTVNASEKKKTSENAATSDDKPKENAESPDSKAASETAQGEADGSRNIAPVADAGTDRTVVLPATSISLHAGANDPDGSIATYRWTQLSGPDAAIRGAGTKNVSISNLKEGVYVFMLHVRDNKGLDDADEVTVYVRNPFPVTIEPSDYEGPDRSTNLPFSVRRPQDRSW